MVYTKMCPLRKKGRKLNIFKIAFFSCFDRLVVPVSLTALFLKNRYYILFDNFFNIYKFSYVIIKITF